MAREISDEYNNLLKRKAEIEIKLPTLPQGYISKKHIGGNEYYYLQARSGVKVTSRYLKVEEVVEVKQQIALRKEYESELPQIRHRLDELETAAQLIGDGVCRRLQILKISVGMDEISEQQKQRCISFADAMTAIEGVPVSDQTKCDLNDWKNGEVTFRSVFETTLRRYGFPVEV